MTVKLHIVVDKMKNKVVFAEATANFVDFIFHILALPIGAVARVLSDTSDLGSIGTLREGLKKLDHKYVGPYEKEYLVDNIKAPSLGRQISELLPGASYSEPHKFYKCATSYAIYAREPCYYSRTRSCCNEIYLRGSSEDIDVVRGCAKGYVDNEARCVETSFMVMDDLTVCASEATAVFPLLNELSIKDVGVIEKREVIFGPNEALKLLKASLTSKTVLTDVFLAGAVVNAEK